MRYLYCFMILITSFFFKPVSEVSFGLFADSQYCDCDTRGSRFYRNSANKIKECINTFNLQDDLEFVAGLGDLIDRDFSSFNFVNKILSNSKHKIYHVIGNHDYEIDRNLVKHVTGKLGISSEYYSFNKKGWKFIFLNGNDISFNSPDHNKVLKAGELTLKIKEEKGPNHYEWNGGIGDKQLKWLERQLKQAKRKRLKVILLCHYPLVPLDAHTLWNHDDVLKILYKYNNVKLWINGHNHTGDYRQQNSIHFVTLKGMVETEKENAYARITLTDSFIKITGYGREETRELPLN